MRSKADHATMEKKQHTLKIACATGLQARRNVYPFPCWHTDNSDLHILQVNLGTGHK